MVDAQLTVTAIPRNGIRLDAYLASAAAAFTANHLQVESAAIHDDLRTDRAPVAVITYTVATGGTPTHFPHGRQAALITADGANLIIASLAARDPETAVEMRAIVSELDLGPRPPARTRPPYHSSNDWSDSPTMRKVR